MYPKVNEVYTLTQIINELDLRDSPCLLMWPNDNHRAAIQDSHILYEDLLAVDGWAELRFTYLRTSEEWIPVFMITPDHEQALLELVTVEPCNYGEGSWVVPKAFPREQ